jgi:TatD DNase family protein
MQFIDTHAHLNFEDYDRDRNEVIKQAIQNGVLCILNVGIDRKTSEESIQLANDYKEIFAAVGWHPHEASSFDESSLNSLVDQPKVVALGEIGLDYYRAISPKNLQKQVFEDQLRVANEHHLPIIVHDRNAHEDVYAILKKYNPSKVVFHCFSGDYHFAQEIVHSGWHISFTGNVTFNQHKYYPIIKDLPEDRFFVETDAPFLTPHPFRGKRNRPEYVRCMIEAISQFRNDSPLYVAKVTTDNAKNFFGF